MLFVKKIKLVVLLSVLTCCSQLEARKFYLKFDGNKVEISEEGVKLSWILKDRITRTRFRKSD